MYPHYVDNEDILSVELELIILIPFFSDFQCIVIVTLCVIISIRKLYI